VLRRGDSRLSVGPTARGWQALAAGAVTLFVARLIGTTQFHQLAYALLALPLASLVLGVVGSRGLLYSRFLPSGTRVTAGDPAKVNLLLQRSRFGATKAGVVDRLPEPRGFEFPPTRGREGSRIEAPLDFARRGVYELGPAEVRVADPFGLLSFARRFEQRMEVIVYPKTHDLRGFPLRGGNVDAGARGSRGRRGEEFAGLREYRRGDDRRHIHWKSVARTGELFVKEFSLQAPRRHTVVLDLRREGIRTQETEVEDAVSTAASVLAHLTRERLPARLLGTDREGASTEFGADEESYWEAARLLATVRADGGRPLGEAVLAERGSLGEGVVLVSRTRDEELPASVRKLRETGLSVIVVALATHTYRTPPGSGGAARSREAEFVGSIARLEAAGAAVRVVSYPAGVGGLAERGNRELGTVR
jgi:uncharacterized protein (DUF58 family)